MQLHITHETLMEVGEADDGTVDVGNSTTANVKAEAKDVVGKDSVMAAVGRDKDAGMRTREDGFETIERHVAR